MNELISRAEKRDECCELAAELLSVVGRSADYTESEYQVRSAVVAGLNGLASPKFRTYVAEELTLARSEARWNLLLDVAEGWRDERIDQTALRRFVKEPSSREGELALWLLDRDNYGPTVPEVVAVLDRKDLALDDDALMRLMSYGVSLTRGSGAHGIWREAQKRYASDRRAVVRRAAVAFLVPTVTPADLPVLVAASMHEDWCTRRTALNGLSELRTPEAIDAVLSMLSRERPGSRLGIGAARTLTAQLGQSFGTDVDSWNRWWLANERKLPPPHAADEPAAPDGIDAPRLFGTMVCSDRIAIVLDIDPLARTALDVPATAKRLVALQDAISNLLLALPAQAEWNVIVARNSPVRWKASLSANPPKPTHKHREPSATRSDGGTERARDVDATREFLGDQLGPKLPKAPSRSNTLASAIYDIWQDGDVDTVLVIADAESLTTGDRDAGYLARYADSLDDHRNVRVHAFGIGGDIPSLRELASARSGEYRQVEEPR